MNTNPNLRYKVKIKKIQLLMEDNPSEGDNSRVYTSENEELYFFHGLSTSVGQAIFNLLCLNVECDLQLVGGNRIKGVRVHINPN
ncbi:hypothetical protein [Photorhabdus laumondii]|uniref:Uncharacterized protein n=1 Tax=Photorhabdus laumondii subsp. clarkei TaxID=2029685 RepID=A0A329VAA2_9GAMM|nr:hypothetical protein [Photorhabdus laumondii]RAW82228.1 hypothetical protein CKY01_22215 [Photorhabdus laumondii subsp. clarkei]